MMLSEDILKDTLKKAYGGAASGPDYILVYSDVYKAFRRELGLSIWEEEFERARLQLARIGA
jgi:hypothetical protein